MPKQPAVDSYRLILLVALPLAYRWIRAWADEREHKISLVLISPARTNSEDYLELVRSLPKDQPFLSVMELTQASPLLRSMGADLIISATFPSLIPVEFNDCAKFGAVNLHPTPLPKYRGPNPARMIFEGSSMGATLHRIDSNFDSGRILCVRECQLPSQLSVEGIWSTWIPLLQSALEEGIEQAARGVEGTAQLHENATYAAPFSVEDELLDFRLTLRVLQQRCVALNLLGPKARIVIRGTQQLISSVTPVDRQVIGLPAGTIVEYSDKKALVVVGDGIAEFEMFG